MLKPICSNNTFYCTYVFMLKHISVKYNIDMCFPFINYKYVVVSYTSSKNIVFIRM